MNEENLFQTIISACLEATGMSQFSHEITKAEKMCVWMIWNVAYYSQSLQILYTQNIYLYADKTFLSNKIGEKE